MQSKDFQPLRECPFCGGESLLRDRYINGVANTKHYIRECRHCKATFANWYRSIKKANEAWNRRADAVPVVRGEWVLQGENERDYETSLEEKCSLCGRYVYRYDTQPQDNYCPKCGAKMEEHHD